MLKTNSCDWLLKESNSNIFLQSSVDHESSLTAHINYGYISSTNSLLRSSLGDCHDVQAQILPHEMLETTGPVSRQHGVVENQASATTVDCTLKSRKRKRISCSGIIKRPRSLYDQGSFDCEKARDELLLKHTEFSGSLTDLTFEEAYWTDNELKAFEIEEYVSQSERNDVVQPADTKQTPCDYFDIGLENKLGKNLKAFQRYIEKCVKPTELIVFFDKFSFEQRKVLHKTIPKNTTKANRQIFNVINAMDDTPDKYTSLFNACEEGGYPKVTEILLGRLVPKNKKHRQAISKAAKHIYQRLSVCDVTPYLLNKGVINRLDVEEVKASEARCEAALELLLLLPNRSRQWFGSFIEALVESNQSELAELVDKKMAKEIQRGMYSRSLHRTSLESVSQSRQQIPQTSIELVHSTNEPVFVSEHTRKESLLGEPENGVGISRYGNNRQDSIFGRFRRSFKKTYNSVIGKRSIYIINE